jgi:zinc transport system permease protein
VFLVTALSATAVRAAPARRHHRVEEHRHEHGADCGHDAVPHGDHVDYVHDGHRHAAHGAHYDDH